MTTFRRLCVALLVPALLSLAACSGDGGEKGETPTESLSAAKKNLDATSGVHIVLATDKLPSGVNGILRADGIGTHAPAFQGTLKVATGGLNVDVPVVSVDDVVYAKLPFTTKFTQVDPGDYSAPDPAVLMGTDNGLSSLLTALRDPAKGKQQRDGKTILNTFTGTLPGEAVASIIPSADPKSDFDATFTVTDDNVLNEAVLTGAFYPKAGDVTYTIRFDQYDAKKDITKP